MQCSGNKFIKTISLIIVLTAPWVIMFIPNFFILPIAPTAAVGTLLLAFWAAKCSEIAPDIDIDLRWWANKVINPISKWTSGLSLAMQ